MIRQFPSSLIEADDEIPRRCNKRICEPLKVVWNSRDSSPFKEQGIVAPDPQLESDQRRLESQIKMPRWTPIAKFHFFGDEREWADFDSILKECQFRNELVVLAFCTNDFDGMTWKVRRRCLHKRQLPYRMSTKPSCSTKEILKIFIRVSMTKSRVQTSPFDKWIA